ncbi:MAG: zinc-finger domain-containing protein [Rhodobacteraceae bacterium]|nr:MAG: zinc-finger domain-containing protein [Paracoccaceae bacterium]
MSATPNHDAPETEIVTAMRVCCDGGEGALGHPRVWLSISHETGMVECPYCDKRFIHADHAAGDAAA